MSLWIQDQMRRVVERKKPDKMISGMALGADQIWAELAVIMNIPFIAAIPFLGQESRWSEEQRNKYRILLEKAAEVVNVSGKDHYIPRFMSDRNEWMVDNADGLVAVWNGLPRGGTFNCVAYANGQHQRIFRIDPNDYPGEEIDL